MVFLGVEPVDNAIPFVDGQGDLAGAEGNIDLVEVDAVVSSRMRAHRSLQSFLVVTLRPDQPRSHSTEYIAAGV